MIELKEKLIKTKNMIITIPSFGLGTTGGDRVLVTLANALTQRGHAVNIVNLGNKTIPFDLNKNVNLISIPFKRNSLKSSKNILEFAITGINKLANNLPESDIYLANWVYTVLPCIANNDKGKTVFLAQANEAYDFGKSNLKILDGISYEAYRLNIPIITPSVHLQKMIKNRFGNNAVIIPPFVDSKKFLPIAKKKKGKLKILFVGNAQNKNKGFEILHKACLKLQIPFELHVATQVDLKIKDTKINLKIHKPKNDKELGAIYRNCDVFLHLSKEEGFGLTLLEAMASGLLCLVSDSGGVNDFAVDGKNCIMVNRNPKDIVQVIEKIVNEKDAFKNKLTSNAINTAKAYSETKMVDSFENLFLNLLK